MNTQNALLGLFAVQVGLAAITWWPSGTATVEARPLIEGGANGVKTLQVTTAGDDAKTVSLSANAEGAWVVDSSFGYLADADKVGEVLDALGGITLRAPIATRASSHDSLGVGEDFEKKVTWTDEGGTEHTIVLGAAASKAIHLRFEGEDDVYKVKGLSAWTIKDNDKAYLPTNYVDFEPDAVSSLSITNAQGSIAFTREADAWLVDGQPELRGKVDAIGDLLEKVGKVRLVEVAGTEVLPEHGLGSDAVRVTWSLTEGDQNVPGGMVIGAEDESAYFVKSDDSTFVVKGPKYKLDAVRDAVPAELTEPAPVPEPIDEAPPEE